MSEELRDYISVEDEDGNEREFSVEAMFDMNEESYALLKDENEIFVMRVEDEGDDQYLVPITDDTEKESILDAYEVAIATELDEE
ncbi:DUF1292 domain-containing protein [Alkalibacillus aidingensis]|uniref:DUF1292 domain-containing protein n=1 Tax=Alkalibacillus aidingensis TaxID=2747607 RepID=UPI001660C126|nr:DUF1292 domain-containing protein [Alkalibacillus aidingensis]